MMPRQAECGTAEPSPLLDRTRRIFLVGWTLINGVQVWLQTHLLIERDSAAHHLSVIGPACMIVGFALLAILSLYNLVYLRNPKSRLYLFRWMST